ncbi:DUF7715 family protein [Nocardioides campestrisoli]|uniref:DUF7715 family protein n=1 Tax=Nocardioides campestrisoli TaxID=2736757 RepID=UPI00163D6B18|nr:hypothetical protein [Nocardioides campestrisoli]
MKLLVATQRTQGTSEEDYAWCVPGELLWLPMMCDDDRLYPEHGCGCSRGFGGLTSHKATTTAEIVERDFSEDDLRLAVTTSLTDQGWLGPALPASLKEEVLAEVLEDIGMVTRHFRVSAVVRRAGDQVFESPMFP